MKRKERKKMYKFADMTLDTTFGVRKSNFDKNNLNFEETNSDCKTIGLEQENVKHIED